MVNDAEISTKDQYHRGSYKTTPNRVEKTMPDGTKIPVFETSAPGLQTDNFMADLVQWYHADNETHALLKVAIFVYEFLSIHPFQDGNGRLSRLLATLLLMKSGYVWIEYVSFEHEIEFRKKEYYQELMEAQRNRPGEDVTKWVSFFLDCLKNIQEQLMVKLAQKEQTGSASNKQQNVLSIIDNNPGIASGAIAKKLNIPSPTVKKLLSEMVASGLLLVHGAGRATTYSIAATDLIKRDITMRFTNKDRVKTFTLQQLGSFVRIKQIILTPLFKWKHPDEWSTRLLENGLVLEVRAVTSTKVVYTQPYTIFGFNTPFNFQPVFVVSPNIIFPDQLRVGGVLKIDYPIQVRIELIGSVETFDFDVMLVTDER